MPGGGFEEHDTNHIKKANPEATLRLSLRDSAWYLAFEDTGTPERRLDLGETALPQALRWDDAFRRQAPLAPPENREAITLSLRRVKRSDEDYAGAHREWGEWFLRFEGAIPDNEFMLDFGRGEPGGCVVETFRGLLGALGLEVPPCGVTEPFCNCSKCPRYPVAKGNR